MKKILLILAFLLSSCGEKMDIYTFIQKDETEKIPYTESFDCKDFTETFIKNASRHGIDSFPVGVGWRDGNNLIFHEFVGVNTTDGVIWVEPQNDRIYNIAGNGEALCYSDGECVTQELVFVYIDH